MKTFIIISVFICSLTFCNSKSKERDWIIVPGEKVGGITQNCTKKDLIDIFGKTMSLNAILIYLKENPLLV